MPLMSDYGKQRKVGLRPGPAALHQLFIQGKLMMTAGSDDLMIDGKQNPSGSHLCISNSLKERRQDLLSFISVQLLKGEFWDF